MRSTCIGRHLTEESNFEHSKYYFLQRNNTFNVTISPKEKSIWERLPPDFRLQAFQPRPLKRRSIVPMKVAFKEDQTEEKEVSNLSTELVKRSDSLNGNNNKFLFSYKDQRPFSAKIDFCRNGMYPKDPYRLPNPHDFRGFKSAKEMGVPEFLSGIEKDPGNIMLNTSAIKIINGPLYEALVFRDTREPTMCKVLKQPSKWNASDYLPRQKWPIIATEYTRHRIIHQNPHEAFLNRVETVLTEKWKRERKENN